MCDPLTAVVAGSAILGGGLSARSASKARKQQGAAMAASEQQAAKQAQRAETQFNEANKKQPAIAALLDANRRAASKGVGSTFLTGTSGATSARTDALGGGPSLLGA